MIKGTETKEKTDWQEKISGAWLQGMPGISRRKKWMLLELCGDVKSILLLKEKELLEILNYDELLRWQQYEKAKSPYQVWQELEESQISFVSCREDAFPDKLRQIPDPPFGIYYRGKLPDAEKPALAMVGARKNSDYGQCMAEHFAERMAQNGVSVISGMAVGIDSYSQRAALRAGGTSYAVLGCGADVVYPPSNRRLYEELLEKGGVLSEYPPKVQPLPKLFPQRNRIISALADAVLVVEAREKSGTLITVDMALEQGKEVYVVPGRCTDSLSRGCNKLLRQGAVAAIGPEDILEDMNWNCQIHAKKEKKPVLSEIAQNVYEVLDILPHTQDEILDKLYKNDKKYTISQLCQGLIELELAGIVQRTYGQYKLSKIKT